MGQTKFINNKNIASIFRQKTLKKKITSKRQISTVSVMKSLNWCFSHVPLCNSYKSIFSHWYNGDIIKNNKLKEKFRIKYKKTGYLIYCLSKFLEISLKVKLKMLILEYHLRWLWRMLLTLMMISFNLALNENRFLDYWKVAKVLLVLKSCTKSVLSNFSKLFESILYLSSHKKSSLMSQRLIVSNLAIFSQYVCSFLDV